MATERFVILGLARAQAGWFSALAQGAASAALPVELVKALAPEELRARLRSGRPFSAVLIDAGLSACDRDLVELASAQGCAVVVVVDDMARDDGRSLEGDERGRFGLGAGAQQPPWHSLGVSAVLPASFGREQLLVTLRAVARPIAPTAVPAEAPSASSGPSPWRGRLVAVTGSGGSGRSTLAMALAAGMATDPRDRGLVVLADLALQAQQGLLHDAGDVVPGLVELVDGHRRAVMAPEQVRRSCFEVSNQGYDLLLGLRRHRDWIALRAPAFRGALDGLRRSYRVVVAEVDADVEGESETGSVDVEERNMLARVTLGEADVVLVVGVAGLAGLHAQLRVLRDVAALGVAAERVVPVINRAPRNPRARAELGRSLLELCEVASKPATLVSSPLFVPERRRLDDLVRDGGRLPAGVVQPLASAVRGLLERVPRQREAHEVEAREPATVVPGTLASWRPIAEEPAR
jgi:Mrp family chromosome partitioning ATPase